LKKPIFILTALWLLGAWFPCALMAQTNLAKAPSSGNRYLLVVDTSSAMQRRSEGTEKTVADLLSSGLEGELQPGDTLGVWTFNEDVYAGRFPLQHWSAEDAQAITARVVSFLKAQKHEKDANLPKVLAAVGSLIKGSDSITVLLVSDGSQELHGTPIDARINDYYKRWSKDQKKARLPFITALRGRGGQVVDFAVTASPWPLGLAKTAPNTKPTDPTRDQLVEAVRKAPISTGVPPLIVSGKKPKPAGTNNQATVTPAITNRIVAAVAGNPAPETSSTNPSVPQVKLPPAEIASAPPAPATNPPIDLLKVESVRPAEIVPTPPDQPMKTNPATVVTFTPPATVASEPPAHHQDPTNSPAARPVTPAPATSAATKPTAETGQASLVTSSATQQATNSSITAQRPQASNSIPAAQAAITPPAPSASSHKAIWIAGIVIVGIGIGCLVAWLRRPVSEGASLITQSLDQNSKQ
jgi:hypothetical protein